MIGISWMEKKRNEIVLTMVKEKRTTPNTMENRSGNMIGHLIGHYYFFDTTFKGKVEGKRVEVALGAAT